MLPTETIFPPKKMSELQTRLDLLKTSSVSSDCLKLFPVGKKKTQRVVVGDNDGSLQAFSIKKGAVNVCSRENKH